MLAYPKLAKLHTILIRREIRRILDNEVKLKKKKIQNKNQKNTRTRYSSRLLFFF